MDPGDYVIGEKDGFPTISLSSTIKESFNEPWLKSVVIKLFGRNIGYKTLCDRIKALWHPVGRYTVIDLENNYFLVKFADKYDYYQARLDSPWMIIGHYLMVQAWQPKFFSF